MKSIDIMAHVDWFSKVGQPIASVGEQVVVVSDWHEAVGACSELNWENVCIQASNDVTMHLNRVCKAEFQKWNEVVNNAKRELSESWKRMRSILENEDLPQVVADCVEWDTMHAVACEHYAAWNPPRFYDRLLSFYQSGHFPCGWIGTWPQGQLRVY